MIVKLLKNKEGGREVEVITVEISDNCPKCDKPRGKPQPTSVTMSGGVFYFNSWANECGHPEDQRELRKEARDLLKLKRRDRLEVSVTCEDHVIVPIFNGIWDRDGFLEFERALVSKEDWVSSNLYDMKGNVEIDMKKKHITAGGDDYYTVTGTAKLIRYKPENH